VIFSPQLAAKVLDGTKTMTRRRVDHRDGRPLQWYHAGNVYAVQPGRGKPHVGHIRVLMVNVVPLRMVTPLDARCEGFLTISDFMDYWMKLYGSWNPEEVVVVIDFQLTERCPECRSLTAVVAETDAAALTSGGQGSSDG
jgi:hypothetical protein